MTQRHALYWHIAFVISCISYLVIRNTTDLPFEWAPKIIPLVLLLAWANWQLDSSIRNIAILALSLSLTGDILLSLNDLFIQGLAAFLLAQLCYARLFLKLASLHKWAVLWGIFVLLYSTFAAYLILPATGPMAIPVGVYLLAISAMVISAGFINGPHSILVMLGAFIFMVSDTLIAINKFISPFTEAGMAIMVTYYLAQYLIIMGLTRHRYTQQTLT